MLKWTAYPSVGQVWQRNWERITPFFHYPLTARHLQKSSAGDGPPALAHKGAAASGLCAGSRDRGTIHLDVKRPTRRSGAKGTRSPSVVSEATAEKKIGSLIRICGGRF